MIFKKDWTKKERALFLVHLGECIADGYPLLLAIQMQRYNQSPSVRRKLDAMLNLLKEGNYFYETLSESGFPGEVCSSVYFAESAGKLAEGLKESGQMMQRREEDHEKLIRLLRYPVLLIWLLCLMVFVIGRYLLPSFIRLYESLSIRLPLITRILILFSSHIYLLISLMLAGCLCFVLAVKNFRRLPVSRQIGLLLRLPGAGRYVRYYLTHHFSFYLGSLLRSGLSVRQAMDSLSEKGTTPFLKYEAVRLRRLLLHGERLEAAVRTSRWYLPELAAVIHHGQLNSMLGPSLSTYSAKVMEKMEQRMQTLLLFCQPALLLVIGGLVLGLFASVLLPVFQMINGL
ncbi:competence type IV pilus assembly protein ComGB [Sporolactobacillus vineae]|uniref:competence type IV pilus assembly protein ComGB n=1 Tax=Sporolactobacillus vineae TaxID=444463 RepID=UPI0002883080|nr:competence type IV pilus assembly protein ComGB [Sporolactobacillus vineae]